SDSAFLGGIVNYIFEHERWFDEYVKAYTNAPVIVEDDFRDTEDLDGLFSGWDAKKKTYDNSSWQYKEMEVGGAAGQREYGANIGHAAHGGHGGDLQHGEPPHEDETLQDPHCVFQIVKRHYSRYTPEAVAAICGCTVEQFLSVAEALCENSGRERTSAFVYSVG